MTILPFKAETSIVSADRTEPKRMTLLWIITTLLLISLTIINGLNIPTTNKTNKNIDIESKQTTTPFPDGDAMQIHLDLVIITIYKLSSPDTYYTVRCPVREAKDIGSLMQTNRQKSLTGCEHLLKGITFSLGTKRTTYTHPEIRIVPTLIDRKIMISWSSRHINQSRRHQLHSANLELHRYLEHIVFHCIQDIELPISYFIKCPSGIRLLSNKQPQAQCPGFTSKRKHTIRIIPQITVPNSGILTLPEFQLITTPEEKEEDEKTQLKKYGVTILKTHDMIMFEFKPLDNTEILIAVMCSSQSTVLLLNRWNSEVYCRNLTPLTTYDVDIWPYVRMGGEQNLNDIIQLKIKTERDIYQPETTSPQVTRNDTIETKNNSNIKKFYNIRFVPWHRMGIPIEYRTQINMSEVINKTETEEHSIASKYVMCIVLGTAVLFGLICGYGIWTIRQYVCTVLRVYRVHRRRNRQRKYKSPPKFKEKRYDFEPPPGFKEQCDPHPYEESGVWV